MTVRASIPTRAARALYSSIDPPVYYPYECDKRCDLGYLGRYSPDRQASLEELGLSVARSWAEGRFIVGRTSLSRRISSGRRVPSGH